MNAELKAAFDELRHDLKYEAGCNTLLRFPTNDERNKLMARQIVLSSAMRSISYTAHGPALGLAGAALAEMFQGFIGWRPDPKVKEQSIGWYVNELRDMPLFAIELACADVRAGRVPDLKPDFPPSSARMVQFTRSHIEPVQREHNLIKQILSVKMVRDNTKADPAMAGRVADKLRDFSNQMKEARIKEDQEHRDAMAGPTIERNERRILDEYRARGMEPVYGPNKKPVSISLLKFIATETNTPASRPNQYQDEGS